MEKDKPLNEEALIASGKEMMRAGLGARFVLGKMKEAIADEEIRSRVMTAILEKPNPLEKQQSQQELIHNRKVRQARFALEDFEGAIHLLKRASMIGVVLAVLMFVSAFVFGSGNLIFGILTLITSIGLWFSKDKVNWNEKSTIVTTLAGWTLFLIVELLVFGFPDQIIPNFGEMDRMKIVHITTMINDFTWLIYPAIRFCMFIPLIMIFYRKNKLGSL